MSTWRVYPNEINKPRERRYRSQEHHPVQAKCDPKGTCACARIVRCSAYETRHDGVNKKNAYSAGVEKSALSRPALSCTEIVTRSLPLPPLLKLLFWKLFRVMNIANREKRRRNILERSFGEAVLVRDVMDGVDHVKRVDTSGVHIDGHCRRLSRILNKLEVEICARLRSRGCLRALEGNCIIPTALMSIRRYYMEYFY